MSSYNNLRTTKENEVGRFTLKGKEKYAKVVSVYDGDTCDMVFYRDEKMEELVRYKCRMSGYDAPELDEKPVGKLARDCLAHLCMGRNPEIKPSFFHAELIWTREKLQEELDNSDSLVYAEFSREGKYGRPVVTLYQKEPPDIQTESSDETANICINDMMKKFIQKCDKNQ